MSKELKPHEKDALAFQMATLLEYDEPSALLATLQRLAERKAFSATRGHVDYESALRWQGLADALASVRLELERQACQPRQVTDC
jgi:hypothetical protein